jgi:pyruvate/2-oxoglutarate dehydrogenase complex dihydrolipoamide dehydrogenase (E3) component
VSADEGQQVGGVDGLGRCEDAALALYRLQLFKIVAVNVFTDPELASVGVSQSEVDRGAVVAHTVHLVSGRQTPAGRWRASTTAS